MNRLVILGSGGHAKVIIDIFMDAGSFEIVGCTSGDPADAGTSVLGIPVIGDDSALPNLFASGVRKAFVAIGDNRLRQKLTRAAGMLGFELVSAVSPRAVISRRAKVGAGVAVMPGAVINVCSEIGDGAIVNTGATIDHDCRLGQHVHIAPGVNLAGCVTVGEGAFLGTGSRLIPGVSVGPWAVVGAGAVVIKDLPGCVTAVGVPAAIIRNHRSEGS
jgi:UDP-perosamine 4-acetyltransferase